MKITIYTIKDCAFSKQEKEYLNTNKFAFEEKDLETNKDFLTEMLAISNNFAGTPVTRVEKDDGTIAVLKGFTKEEFDTTFGLVPQSSNQATNNPSPTIDSTVKPPINDTPLSPTPAFEPIAPLPTEPISDAPVPSPSELPIKPTPTDSTASDLSTEASAKADPLKSVMDDLQTKSSTDQPVSPPPAVEPVPPSPVMETPPVVPPPPPEASVTTPPADAPVIPDFPAK